MLAAQKTTQHRKRAIEILESLIDKNLANAEDRFLLARLYEVSGDWPKARETYRDLNLRTKNPRDLETLNRRPCIWPSSCAACFEITRQATIKS